MMTNGESGFVGGGSSDLDESERFIEVSFMYDVDVTAVEDDAKEDSSDDDRSSEELDRSGRYLLISPSRFSSNGDKSPSYSVSELAGQHATNGMNLAYLGVRMI